MRGPAWNLVADFPFAIAIGIGIGIGIGIESLICEVFIDSNSDSDSDSDLMSGAGAERIRYVHAACRNHGRGFRDEILAGFTPPPSQTAPHARNRNPPPPHDLRAAGRLGASGSGMGSDHC